ncbi:MAG: hypothetical protein FWC70_03930 [Defluviitaleaceae bacterium]|nr:hypothetical protein [Defluviitaleaceae bacterium]
MSIVVANTRKTYVRIADTAIFREHFPMGKRMNEKTHVFDASFFENKCGKKCCFMAALSVEAAEELVQLAPAAADANAFESVHRFVFKKPARVTRIETAEHLAFRKFCPLYESAFVFLPQDDGLRVLHIHDNLPAAAHFISNNPAYRAGEFLLFCNSLENLPKIAVVRNEAEFAWLREHAIIPEECSWFL